LVYGHPSRLLRWLFPPVCSLCGASGHRGLDLCADCLSELPHNRRCCGHCALPLPQAVPEASCGTCQRHPPCFDRCLAPLIYETPVRELIGRFKYGGDLATGLLLAELLGAFVEQQPEPYPEVLVPVPLHPQRLRERGFNQAMELARLLGHRLGIPVAGQACRRVRATAPQSRLDKRARRRNVRGAFDVQRPPQVRHLTLIDDVMTTGSTADELARVLKGHGTARVDVWVCARRP